MKTGSKAWGDPLGDRMKMFECKDVFMPQIPIIARIDGRGFHRFTRGLNRPFDVGLTTAMQDTTTYLMKQANADYGYTQSDEISLVWMNNRADPWFGGKVQKYVSVLAALASTYFCSRIPELLPSKVGLLPVMDCRVFQVPNLETAVDVIHWREMDATRNSLQMLARSLYSHKECHGKSSSELHDMLHEKNQNWNDLPAKWKRGSHFRRVKRMLPFESVEDLPPQHAARLDPNLQVVRSVVEMIDLPPMYSLVDPVNLMFGEWND